MCVRLPAPAPTPVCTAANVLTAAPAVTDIPGAAIQMVEAEGANVEAEKTGQPLPAAAPLHAPRAGRTDKRAAVTTGSHAEGRLVCGFDCQALHMICEG